MSTAIIMIGFPACGKTTFRENIRNKIKDFEIISFDDILEEIALKNKISYNETFLKYVEEANNILKMKINGVIKNKRNVIFDQTNLTKKKRVSLIKRLRNAGYKKIVGVYFNVPLTVCKKRSLERAKITGKVIPDEVFEKMADIFEKPTKDEGYDSLVTLI